MTDNNELMRSLTISVDGKRGLLDVNASADVYSINGKLNLKTISQAGLIAGREVSAINVELFESDTTICNASIKDGKWNVIAESDDSTTLIDRTGTFKSGQKNIPDSEKLLDMRFDMTHIVKGMLEKFFPQLEVRGTSDNVRSEFAQSLINSIVWALEDKKSKDVIEKRLRENLTDKQWTKVYEIAVKRFEAQVVETEESA